MPTDAQRQLDIAQAVSNRMSLLGMEDNWPNRIAFYQGMLFGWSSDYPTNQENLQYNYCLDQLIEEAKRIQATLDSLEV